MSGGSYDYAFSHVSDMADRMAGGVQTPLRIEFAALLERVSVAMRAVEWVDSGDCSYGDEDASIRACFDYARSVNTAVPQDAEQRKELENFKSFVLPMLDEAAGINGAKK